MHIETAASFGVKLRTEKVRRGWREMSPVYGLSQHGFTEKKRCGNDTPDWKLDPRPQILQQFIKKTRGDTKVT